MIDAPQIVHSEPRSAAVIRHTVARAEIENVMGPSSAEALAAVAAHGLQPAGPLFSHHLKMGPGNFDFEVGGCDGTRPAGNVRPGELPATKAARSVYHGLYEGLGAVRGEFNRWIEARGLKRAPDLWESYVDPESGADPAA